MSKSGVKLTTGKIPGTKYHVEYAVAQLPTHKDEDMFMVYDQSNNRDLGTMAGAVFMLFDGHGGKEAADMCTKGLMTHLTQHYQAASANLRQADSDNAKDALKAKTMQRNAWMGYMMDTVVEESFHKMDLEVKKATTAGTTASVLFISEDPLDGTELQSVDSCVLVKCAWVGDSRCTRGDLGPKGFQICEDLSRDHRPETGPEMARLSQSVHGAVDISKDKIVVMHDVSARGAPLTLSLSVRGERGALEPFNETFKKLEKDLEPHGGFSVCYDTPGFPVESSVHGPRSGSRHGGSQRSGLNLSQSLKATSSGQSIASMGSEGSGSLKARVRKPVRAATDTAGNLSAPNNLSSQSGGSSDKENDESAHSAVSKRASVAGIDEEKPTESGYSFGTPIVKENAVGKTIELPSNVSSLETNDQGETIAKDSDGNAFFLGRLHANGLISGKRIFYPSGASTAFTRSIGDVDAGNILISKPEINTIEVPVQPGSRFIICSDGVWDCVSTPDAHKMLRNMTAAKAASKLASESLNKRRYGGLAADDITVMIIDVKYTAMDPISSVGPGQKKAPAKTASAGVSPTAEVEPETVGCGCFARKKTVKVVN